MKRYFELGLILLASFGAVFLLILLLSQFMPTAKELEPAARTLLEMHGQL